MKIAILSGKGGTGKTLISTNLVNVLSRYKEITLLDCDVEEPNCSIFFDFEFKKSYSVNTLIPVIDNDKCIKCNVCQKNCQFGAINSFDTGIFVFSSLCHGCGVCVDVCPEYAITKKEKSIGKIDYGNLKNIVFGQGILNIGEPSGVKIINKLKSLFRKNNIQILDSPPGASCSVVETLKSIDYAIIVTEPTPFGLHDLKKVQEILVLMNINHGVIINKYEKEYEELNTFLNDKNIDVLEKINFSKEIAELYSNGELISNFKKYDEYFINIAKKVGV